MARLQRLHMESCNAPFLAYAEVRFGQFFAGDFEVFPEADLSCDAENRQIGLLCVQNSIGYYHQLRVSKYQNVIRSNSQGF